MNRETFDALYARARHAREQGDPRGEVPRLRAVLAAEATPHQWKRIAELEDTPRAEVVRLPLAPIVRDDRYWDRVLNAASLRWDLEQDPDNALQDAQMLVDALYRRIAREERNAAEREG
jgi:hypothetical protein